MPSLFIDDGYQLTKTIPAAPGFHGPLEITYRPGVSRERHAYAQKLNAKEPTAIESFEVELVLRHAVTVNGIELKEKDKVRRLHPVVSSHLVDLILSYAPADEEKDVGNFTTG